MDSLLAEEIKEFLKAEEITQRELGELLGVEQQQISHYITGRSQMSKKRRAKWEEILQLFWQEEAE